MYCSQRLEVSEPLQLESYMVVSYLTWVLGTNPLEDPRARVLNYCAILSQLVPGRESSSQPQPGYCEGFTAQPSHRWDRPSIVFRSICIQSSPLRIGMQRVSLCSKARISAGVCGVSPAALTASGNLAAEAEARQHREMVLDCLLLVCW